MDDPIEVEAGPENELRVTVGRGNGATRHRVRVDPAYARKLAGEGVDPASLVRESFRFLLEREPKEAILASFELQAIARYFPEYEHEIRARLD